jgi:hypothetical protein
MLSGMITAGLIVLCVAVIVLAAQTGSWPGYAALLLALVALLLVVVPGLMR